MLSASTVHKSLLVWLETVVVDEFPLSCSYCTPPVAPTLPAGAGDLRRHADA